MISQRSFPRSIPLAGLPCEYSFPSCLRACEAFCLVPWSELKVRPTTRCQQLVGRCRCSMIMSGCNCSMKCQSMSPNPPTRRGLGVGTRGEGRGTRRSALDSDKWGRWRPLVVVGGADGGPGSGAGAGSAGQHAGEDNRGPGRCDSVGRLGSLVDGSGAVGAVRQAKAGLAIEPGRE